MTYKIKYNLLYELDMTYGTTPLGHFCPWLIMALRAVAGLPELLSAGAPAFLNGPLGGLWKIIVMKITLDKIN